MTAIFISLLFFIGYQIYYISIYGIQRSISDSWYCLHNDKKRKNEGLFTIATWGYTLPLLIATANNCFNLQLVVLFAACAMICFVGSAPDFKHADKGWHSFFAEGGIALVLLYMLLSGDWRLALSTVALIIPLMLIKKVKNNTFFIEVIAYFSFVLTTLI